MSSANKSLDKCCYCVLNLSQSWTRAETSTSTVNSLGLIRLGGQRVGQVCIVYMYMFSTCMG